MTDALDSARSKWREAVVATEAGEEPGGGPSPWSRPEDTLAPEDRKDRPAPEPETPTVTREKIKRLLALGDGMARKALELPEREGVEVDLSDADGLDMAAELITPWAEQNSGALTPGVQAGAGVFIIVAELLRDGAWDRLEEGVLGAATSEETEPEDVPERADPDW